MMKIAVLVSGGGTNLQAILESERRGENPNGKVTLVVASKPGVYALERAANFGVETAVVRRKDYATSEEFDTALLSVLKDHGIELVVLAGFLSVLGPSVIAAYPNRILNIHPSLIPSFCGPGYYGLKVHEEALKRGVKVTGATVHFVNEVYDGGPILLQKAVEVQPGDWLTSMHWTTKTGSTAQSRKSRLPSCRPSWIKYALNSPLHVPVWKSCKAIFQPLTSAPKLRKNRLPRWSPVPNR